MNPALTVCFGWLCPKSTEITFGVLCERKNFPRKGAKAQRKPLETRQRFAPLRERSSPKVM